jgi:dTDP-4-amino-4,6-dideoxygalactose transaminase
LKVFIDTNVLIDVAVRADQFPDSLKLINDMIEWDEASLWISAISLYNLEYELSRSGHKEKARNFLKFIQQTFSIIPFGRSEFANALDSNALDLEAAVQMSCAESLGANYFITRNSDYFKDSTVPVLTPEQFLEKWNAGEFDICGQVPFLDLKAQHPQIYNEIDDKMKDIIANTGFILGKYVDDFERDFAEIQRSKYCIGVSSGTDALHVALMTLGIGPGDAVIVPVNTFIATAEAVSLCGATPVFVDCDEYFNLDVCKLEEILQKSEERKTEDQKSRRAEGGKAEKQKSNNGVKAVIPVHLYGQPANMDRIMEIAEKFGGAVVEDACQAHLARWQNKRAGNFGTFGAFSFYPGKNLGAWGEAGALITNDKQLYEHAKMIRQHGEIERYHHKVIGHNYRMEAFQGAVLSTKLKYIKQWTKQRQENAALYKELLADVHEIETPRELIGAECVYHLYVIQAERRDELQAYLGEKNIGTGLHYPIPLHLQEAYAHLGYKEGDFPVAEKAAERILSLPMYPELSERQVRYVCDKIKEFYH